MVFFLATLMTAAVFISERMDGIWDRTLLAGVSATEMLWAHLLTQLIIMALQSFEVIMYIGLVFDTYNNGDTTTLIGLLTLTAFCGMLFGKRRKENYSQKCTLRTMMLSPRSVHIRILQIAYRGKLCCYWCFLSHDHIVW